MRPQKSEGKFHFHLHINLGQNKGIINSSRLSDLPAFEENIKMYNDLAVDFS